MLLRTQRGLTLRLLRTSGTSWGDLPSVFLMAEAEPQRRSSSKSRASVPSGTRQVSPWTRCVTEVNVNVSNCVEIDRNDFGTETGRNVASWHTSAPFRTILLAAARWGLLVPFRFVSVPFWYI